MTNSASTITFACPGCGKQFTVPASYVGRKASCKACGGPVVVPMPASVDEAQTSIPEPAAVIDSAAETFETSPPVAAEPIQIVEQFQEAHQPIPSPAVEQPATPKIPVRTRRLIAEAQQMAEAFKDFPLIHIKSTVGDPPEIYQIEYQVKGLHRGWLGKPKPRENHLVEIQLTSDYPRMAPHCKMLTPIFHPNIDPTTICVGDHWTAGERLVDLVVRIGEMIAYQAYNIKSPLDGEAAMWADLNGAQLPIDSRGIAPGPRENGAKAE